MVGGSVGDGVGAISEGFSMWSSCDGMVRFHTSSGESETSGSPEVPLPRFGLLL